MSCPVQKDPSYALAYAGLADAYASIGAAGVLPPSEAHPRAKVAAIRALELAPDMAEAHAALAFSRLVFDWDWPAAERGFKQALSVIRTTRQVISGMART